MVGERYCNAATGQTCGEKDFALLEAEVARLRVVAQAAKELDEGLRTMYATARDPFEPEGFDEDAHAEAQTCVGIARVVLARALAELTDRDVTP